MPEQESQAIGVEAGKRDLLAALARHPAMRGSKATMAEPVRWKAQRGRLTLEGLGATVSCRATIGSAGAIWMPVKVAVQMRRAARSLKSATLHMSFQDGAVEIERYGIRHPGITRRRPAAPSRARMAPAPAVLELLAFARHVGPEKVALAQLQPRVDAAQREADRLLRQAAELLQPLGIGVTELTRLFEKRMGGKNSRG